MIRAVLFDLDDTLLGNNMERFIPHYFSLLSEYAQPLFSDKKTFLRELLAGTQAMIQNQNTTITNQEVFWSVFSERTGIPRETAEPFFHRFYQQEFPRLQEVTQRRPMARQLVEHCFARQLPVAIATNPLFPLIAIEHRLAWAGVPVSEFDYAMVTAYENVHAAKPHQAYYREVLAAVNAPPEQALMAGDDWANDIAPAAGLGMRVFWIADEDAVPPDETIPLAGRGSLDDLYQFLTANS